MFVGFNREALREQSQLHEQNMKRLLGQMDILESKLRGQQAETPTPNGKTEQKLKEALEKISALEKSNAEQEKGNETMKKRTHEQDLEKKTSKRKPAASGSDVSDQSDSDDESADTDKYMMTQDGRVVS